MLQTVAHASVLMEKERGVCRCLVVGRLFSLRITVITVKFCIAVDPSTDKGCIHQRDHLSSLHDFLRCEVLVSDQ